MTKPYLLIEIIEGRLGAVHERENFNELVEIGVKIAQEQDPSILAEDVQKEFEQDLCWATNSGDTWLYLAQAD
jgi:hypothetical protein